MGVEIKRFVTLLFLIWTHLGLPEPTKVQKLIANQLQYGAKRQIIECFRGIGKSWITAAFVCFLLLRDPQIKILVVSQSQPKAVEFIKFVKGILESMPIFKHLVGDKKQSWSDMSFDVAPKRPDIAPSCKAVGITGQMTGSRADVIIADDVETLNNSQTQGMRDRIAEIVKEFDAILKPNGRIIYLGTPQLEDSLYNKLRERGYKIFVIPARYPSKKQLDGYGEDLAAEIFNEIVEDPKLEGKTVEPSRFTDMDLAEREASYGRSGFSLQFMIDTSLSDENRYPLKLSDLIVMDCDPDKAPERIIWASSPELAYNDLHCVGMGKDRFYRPLQFIGDWVNYTGSVLTIDPSGKGNNETSYAVTKFLNGYVYALKVGGYVGGYTDETLQNLADIAKAYKVNAIQIESNYGGGMFTKLFEPFITKTYPCKVEEVCSKGQKERRIIDTLEPVMNRHKLVIAKSIIEEDKRTTEQWYPADICTRYQLFYQMTRITKDPHCLSLDDRIEVLSMGVGYWQERMNADAELLRRKAQEELEDQALQDFMRKAIRNNPQFHHLQIRNCLDREL